jgi:hypothetical protein
MIKMRELGEEYPIIVDKYIPCLSSRYNKIIDNDVTNRIILVKFT